MQDTEFLVMARLAKVCEIGFELLIKGTIMYCSEGSEI